LGDPEVHLRIILKMGLKEVGYEVIVCTKPEDEGHAVA
jgi:hypothetical protein